MAETIKSALFLDYDSLHRSLTVAGQDAAERLAERAGAWLAAIESGRLVTAKNGDSRRRRVLIRRCYADPKVVSNHRAQLVAAGFEVVDCPPLEGRERGDADIHLVLDAVNALDHPTGYDEFLLVAPDSDLTPALHRIRAHNRSTAIYANRNTPPAYRAIPDALIEEAEFVQLLTGSEPATAAAAAEPGGGGRQPEAMPTDRSEVEALARKVHNSTSIPLFSPRTFADLFRLLAQEIAENGYHFQNTAENVAARLSATGRNVTRRQVVFVVKGLALKGHVFSTTDTADKLAEVFREQVIYLIGNSGLTLDEKEMALLPAWIVGHVATATPAAPANQPAPPPAKPSFAQARPAPKAAEPEEPKPAKRRAKEGKSGKAPAQPTKATPAAKSAQPPVQAPATQPETPPAPPAAASQAKPAPAAAPAATKTAAAPTGPGAPGRIVIAPSTPTRSIEEIRAAVAARAAAMRPAAAGAPPAQPKPAPMLARQAAAPAPGKPATPAAGSVSNAVPSSRPQPAPDRPTARPANPPPFPPRVAPNAAQPKPALGRNDNPPGPAPSENKKDALESSILAAIAQAVDVLVEDGSASAEPPAAESAPPMTSPTPELESAPTPEPVTSEAGDGGGDIGDEIQRIIASYTRARRQGDQH